MAFYLRSKRRKVSTEDADNTWNFTITGTASLSQLGNSHWNSGVCGFHPVPYAEIRPSCPLNLMNFDNVYDIISRRWKKNIFTNVTLNIWRVMALSSWKSKLYDQQYQWLDVIHFSSGDEYDISVSPHLKTPWDEFYKSFRKEDINSKCYYFKLTRFFEINNGKTWTHCCKTNEEPPVWLGAGIDRMRNLNLFYLQKEGSVEHCTPVFCYLMEKYWEDGATFFSEVHSGVTRTNRHKLNMQNFH